jgi:hypothetical protein
MRNRLKTAGAIAAALTLAAAVAAAQTTLPVINVTVQYTGKSTVSEKTPIWVYLFNIPNPNASTPPITAKPLAKNGGVVQFEYGGSAPLYVHVALDRQGGYDVSQGPPPAGSPIGNYSVDGKTASIVKVTPITNVKISFNDSVVFKQ